MQRAVRLTETQRSAIADAVRRDNKAVEPSVSFVASVGAPVPPAIELYILPDAILAEVPAAKTREVHGGEKSARSWSIP